ncbi:hypothetical protein PsorP6_000996 [Peronosclerospora sorghi]|uniref:Uncharacterized protein n=1 Tax=Peronosclerospora sorghi TaxID=230839 RepID=A0ACC0WT15_9STRA|nr:hypothetical protein PsorP6_000996 [Peronosclerospora sorghi]
MKQEFADTFKKKVSLRSCQSLMSRLRLRQLMVLSRDLAKSKHFYQEGLGLILLRFSDTFSELDTQTGVYVLQVTELLMSLIRAMDAKYKLRIFAILKLCIPDLSDAVPRLLMLGAIMDDPIKYPAHDGGVAITRWRDDWSVRAQFMGRRDFSMITQQKPYNTVATDSFKPKMVWY